MSRFAFATLAAIAVVTAAGAVSAQTSIQPGRSVNGELTSRDTRWATDNTPMDCYVLRTTAGQSYTVEYRSGAFDAFLAAGPGRNCQGSGQTVFDDDSGGGPRGLDSRLTFTGDGNDWFIRANAIAEDSAGAYTLAVTASSAPSAPRPPSKPPSGGAAVAGGGGGSTSSASSSGLVRPRDPQERYTWDAICAAVDTVALILVAENITDAELEAWLTQSSRLQNAVSSSGAALGKTEDQINDEVAGYGAAYFQDESLFTDAPPDTMRAACLQVVP